MSKKISLSLELFLIIYFLLIFRNNSKQIKMNIKEAKELFEEIVELCYESENPRLIEVIEEIYPEASKTRSIPKLLTSLEELQVAINEIDILPEEEDCINEIQEKIELLSE
jgi:hypothetical protein